MKRDRLRIGDVARELNIKKSLIRLWEKEFGLNTQKNTYTIEDMKVFVNIKELVRTKGLSIDQAKAELQVQPITSSIIEEPILETSSIEEPILEANTEIIIDIKKMPTIEENNVTIQASSGSEIKNFKKELLELKGNLIKLKRLLLDD